MAIFSFPSLGELANPASIRAEFEKRTLQGKRDLPDLEAARTAVQEILANVVAAAVWPELSKQLRDGFEEVFDRHELIRDARPLRGDAMIEWDEALSQAMEGWLGPDVPKVLGRGWVGEMMDGPRLHEATVRTRIAEDCARRLAAALGNEPPLAIALALGLGYEDLDAAARLRVVQAAQPATPDWTTGDPEEAVVQLGSHLRDLADLGRSPDKASFLQELELIGDYDAVLSPGAVKRLGLDDALAEHIVAYRGAVGGTKWAETLFQEALEAPEPEPVDDTAEAPEALPEPPKPAEKPKPRRGRPRLDAKRPAGRPADRERRKQLERALLLINAHSGTSGRDIAEHLGITQTNWSRMTSGKMDPRLDDTQLEKLIANAEAHIAGLQEATRNIQDVMLK